MTLLLKSFVIQYISSSLFHNPLKFSTMPEPELKKRQCNRLRCSKKCTKKINKQQCPSGFKEILEAIEANFCKGIDFVFNKTKINKNLA